METLTNWRKLTNPDYLGAYDFQPGEERIVTIKEVKREMVKSDRGSEECTVVHFVEPYKPMIMNVTNCKMLSRVYDTPYIEQWTGKSFKIVVAKIKAFGDVVDALRIKQEKVLPILSLGTKNFEACKEAIKLGKATIANVKAKFNVSAEVEAQLNG